VLRNRESLCVLKAQGNALTLNTLRFASEIRSADQLRLPVNEKLVPNEVNLALKLIEGMTAEFDSAKYHDTSFKVTAGTELRRKTALRSRPRSPVPRAG
jgi:DNA end-binding protein Ku